MNDVDGVWRWRIRGREVLVNLLLWFVFSVFHAIVQGFGNKIIYFPLHCF